MLKFLRLWLPVFFWCVVIFYFSSLPSLSTGLGIWDFILRKIAHITEYLILTFLIYRAVKGSFRLSNFYLVFWPSILSFLYAVSDEFHQTFVAARSGNLTDILIDTLGIIIFYILLRYEQKRIKG